MHKFLKCINFSFLVICTFKFFCNINLQRNDNADFNLRDEMLVVNMGSM